jgi:Flp pilus assembly CpaE family ATPase
MQKEKNSILIVGRTPEVSARLARAFGSSPDRTLASESSSFTTMNGHASEIALRHDVVIFEADPDNIDELDAITSMLKGRREGTFFVALTDENMPIAKARRLREAGVDEVLPETIDGGELSDLVDARLRSFRERKETTTARGSEGQVIAIAQARGGIGATTVAVNLALELVGRPAGILRKSTSSRVALVDLDVQFGNAGIFLDIEDNGGFKKLVESRDPPDAQFIKGIMAHHRSGLDILSAPAAVAPLHLVSPDLMASFFDVLRHEYDHVIVDLPHALVEWLEPVIVRTQTLVVVTDTSVPCIRQARRIIDFYKEANLGLGIDLVVNRESKPLIRSEGQKEAETVLGTRFVHWIPENGKAARRAVDLGRPIVEAQAGSDMGKALRKLAAVLREAPAGRATVA